MSNPELNPFVEADACSTCPSNQFAPTSNNDDLSCCDSNDSDYNDDKHVLKGMESSLRQESFHWGHCVK